MTNNRAIDSDLDTRQLALIIIFQYFEYEKVKVAKHKASQSIFKGSVENNLDYLLDIQNLLHKATSENWTELLKAELPKMQFGEKSQTLEFLNYIANKNFKMAQKMIAAQNKKNPIAVVPYTGKTPTAFTVGKEVDAGTAQLLAHQFFSRDNLVATKSSGIDVKDSFKGHTDLSKFVFLGHGSVDTYGDYNAREFAKVFEKRFTEASTDKNAKNKEINIYLIGCEVGREDDRNDSLAQKIANELYGKGFTNLVVHSAYRKHKDETLIVEVLTKPHAFDRRAEKGFIRAKSYTREQIVKLTELEKNQDKNRSEIRKLTNAAKAEYLHPQDMLDQPENIFKPNQNRKQRELGVTQQKNTLAAQEKEDALKILHGKLAEVESRLLKICYRPRTEYLKKAIELVEEADVGAWPGALAQHLVNNQQDWMTSNSTTYECMLSVSKRNFKGAEKFVKDPVPQETKAPEPVTNAQLTSYLGFIKNLIADLNNEIEALQKTTYWFSLFKKFETNTKLKKVEALQGMASVSNLNTLQEKAKENLGVRRVRWSLKTERTKNLLETISSIKVK